MSETGQMTRAAGVVGLATLASRVLGFVRDAATAWFFGAGIAADAFFVAYRLPNLLRRLFAEGALTVAFVPVFSEHLEKQGKKSAFAMAGAAFRLLALVLLFVSAAGVLFAPWIVSVAAPGFAKDPGKLALTVSLTRVLFPFILFVSLAALAMGILNSLGHFATPAFSPVPMNVAMIASVFLFTPFFDPPVMGLAWGVILGGILQFAVQVPSLVKRGIVPWRGKNLLDPGVRRVVRLMGPSVIGAATYQINVLVGTLLASLLPSGSVSYLYYADRVVEFPLGIFGIALATAALPGLSRLASRGDIAGARESFSHAMRLVFFITLPASVGLIALSLPIVEILFGRGRFTPLAARETSVALIYYSIGLCAFSAVRVAVNVLYAFQDTVTPMRLSVLGLVANMVFAVALMGPMRHGGLALATTLASFFHLALLGVCLRRRLGSLAGRAILVSFMKTALASLAMGGLVLVLARWLPLVGDHPLRVRVVSLALCVFAGAAVFAAAAWLLKSPELTALAGLVRGRMKRHGRAA
jgi:putative peptidoglycan lipid II flippase